jgi:hypothetical protein
MPLPAALNLLHGVLAQRSPVLLSLTAHRHHRLDALPGHPRGPCQPRLPIDQRRPIPVPLHNAPAALNRLIFAGGGRGIPSRPGLAHVGRTRHHAMQKLRTPTTEFRPMVHVELSPLSSALGWRGHGLPRGCKRLNETSTGCGGTATGHVALPARFLHAATRERRLPAPAVVSPGCVLAPGHTTARTRPHVHCRFPSDAHALAPSRCRGVGLLFWRLSTIAAVSVLFFCGWAFTPWRRRQPRRCSPAALVEGAGRGLSLEPWALRPAHAPGAGRRGEASRGRHGGACGAWAAAWGGRASAPGGWASSLRRRPLPAAWAPRPLRPGRLSARPNATV